MNYYAVIMLIDDHWDQFVSYCKNEWDAKETSEALEKNLLKPNERARVIMESRWYGADAALDA